MSADNWAVCPRCTKRREKELRDMDIAIAEAYGEIPLDEWEMMRGERAVLAGTPVAERFREDYEFYGLQNGEVIAEYSGSCETCGLALSFTHTHEIEGIDE